MPDTSKLVKSPVSPSSPELYVTSADDEPNVSFEPVCTLPENVEVKTGEEDEDVLYEHRAKLYRFSNGEWKERGIGDVKLLKHRSSGVVRIVMRRERVLKLCMNHRVTPSLNLQMMPSAGGKAWMWHDFSEGLESTHEHFSLRFKTEDIANEFRAAFDKAKLLASTSFTRSENPPSLLSTLLTSDVKDDDDGISGKRI